MDGQFHPGRIIDRPQLDEDDPRIGVTLPADWRTTPGTEGSEERRVVGTLALLVNRQTVAGF